MLILATVLALVGAALLYQWIASVVDQRRYPPPGRLVRVGKRRLHLFEQGQGEPTVVLESGIAASSLNWRSIQQRVAGFARVVSYDRLGLGWSDSCTGSRTAMEMTEELHALLREAQVPGPYLLVGHSFGGLLVRVFATRFPEQVTGLVLVDPVPISEWATASAQDRARLTRGAQLSRRGALLARLGVVRFSLALLASGARRLPQWVARRSSGNGASVLTRLVGEVGKMPPEVLPFVRSHWSHPKAFRGMAAHLECLPASAAALAECECLPDVPLVVLSAGDASQRARAEHEQIARRAPQGVLQIVERSNHWIHLNEPELVVAAIRSVAEAARQRVSA